MFNRVNVFALTYVGIISIAILLIARASGAILPPQFESILVSIGL